MTPVKKFLPVIYSSFFTLTCKCLCKHNNDSIYSIVTGLHNSGAKNRKKSYSALDKK